MHNTKGTHYILGFSQKWIHSYSKGEHYLENSRFNIYLVLNYYPVSKAHSKSSQMLTVYHHHIQWHDPICGCDAHFNKLESWEVDSKVHRHIFYTINWAINIFCTFYSSFRRLHSKIYKIAIVHRYRKTGQYILLCSKCSKLPSNKE